MALWLQPVAFGLGVLLPRSCSVVRLPPPLLKKESGWWLVTVGIGCPWRSWVRPLAADGPVSRGAVGCDDPQGLVWSALNCRPCPGKASGLLEVRIPQMLRA